MCISRRTLIAAGVQVHEALGSADLYGYARLCFIALSREGCSKSTLILSRAKQQSLYVFDVNLWSGSGLVLLGSHHNCTRAHIRAKGTIAS